MGVSAHVYVCVCACVCVGVCVWMCVCESEVCMTHKSFVHALMNIRMPIGGGMYMGLMIIL